MDVKIIQACRKQQREGQRLLYEQMGSKLYYTCKRYLKKEEDIEEVMADAFYTIFTKIEQLKEDYFPNAVLRMMVQQPFVLTENVNKWDMMITVKGGGSAAQAAAIRLGISRALLQYNDQLRTLLRGAMLLTRDPRMKERKKPGRKAARRRFQFSKR